MRNLRFGIALMAVLLAVSAESAAQEAGTCKTGAARSYLDANQVRAGIFNSGNLFWKGSGNIYTVPKSGNANAIFASSIWIGGLVEGELRFAGTDYGPFEYFPGPLNEDGGLPNPLDCSEYDRIYEVTVRDLERLDETGEATADIQDWPWDQGAPVADGDGNPDNYDLAGGDRPEITGHQMLWWVMNDVGGPHGWSQSQPLGIEIQVSAFSVLSTDAALDHATFYQYRITNKQSHVIDSVYFGFWKDADLGNASDDFVGSDTTLGMSFIYNGDDDDQGSHGYGAAPPAIGFDFIQGPVASGDGVDNDGDGLVDEEGERMGMTLFLYYNGDSTPQGNPFTAMEAYNYLRGIWRDGKPMTFGGTGYGGDQRTSFMFPGDPVTGSFWSEVNVDGAGSRNHPSDRRSLMSTGPFRLEPHETQEIVVAIVWARGDDYLDSVDELRSADRTVQDAWDSSRLQGTPVPPIPTVAPALLSPADRVDRQPTNVTLYWQRDRYASEYFVDLAASPDFEGPSHRVLTSFDNSVEVDSLMPFTDYYWRVQGESAMYETPVSQTFRFRTSDVQQSVVGVQTIPGTTNYAFLEIAGPGGVDPCEGRTVLGCPQAGGDLVYASFNSTGEYIMYSERDGPEASLAAFTPNDFDIRFTPEGSYGTYMFGSGHVIRVPFEVWDVGPVGLYNENDPQDDIQLIPVLLADGGGDCAFGYGEADDPFGLGWAMSDRVYAYYATSSYDDWAAAVEPLVESAVDGCYEGDDALLEMIDVDRGRPLQGITFNGDPDVSSAPAEGTVIRFYTSMEAAAAPLPAAPASGTGPHEQPLTLWWNAQYGPSVTYQIQISAGPTFDSPAVDATTKEESFVVSGLAEGQTYLWRTRLASPEGPWSDTWTFTAGVVTNVSAEPPADLPAELTLHQNYPNPFNPSTTIRFGLPEDGPASVVIYDLLGRRVETLFESALQAGWHDVAWDASALASGVYVYTIETEDRRLSRTLLLVK